MVEIKEEDIEIVNLDKPDHGIRYLYVHTHSGFSQEKCEQLKQQILQDHEDVKKWNEFVDSGDKEEWDKLCNLTCSNPNIIDYADKLENDNRELMYNIEQFKKDRQIVKRLEERLIEVKKQEPSRELAVTHRFVISELQKILEGKND